MARCVGHARQTRGVTRARLVLPHQLFTQQLDRPDGRPAPDLVVLVEPDLFFRQFPFHQQKLVLHRASMLHFRDRLEEAGLATAYVESRADVPTETALRRLLEDEGVETVEVFEVVDDWLERDLRAVAEAVGATYDERPTPNFLTCTEDCRAQMKGRRAPRMQHFYSWQRRRLDMLMDGSEPVGGRWSFDTENRKRLPKGLTLPAMPPPGPDPEDEHVSAAIRWVSEEFGDNPGRAEEFCWPVTPEQAEDWLASFVAVRLVDFGPYEDAIAAGESWLFHSALSSSLNIGLLDPAQVVRAALEHAEQHQVPLASLEGFVRQVIGWREYMRAAYVVHGRRMRTRNLLGFSRPLPKSWYDATTGLAPLDTVIERVLRTAYSHHIERLMVLGNATALLRIDPDEVYAWFMALFIDAYDWVMVPNVYAMSQFAAGELITTKPYVSGSNYLRKMSDLPTGDWTEVWDALYWQFVADHREGFSSNPRSSMAVRTYDRMDAGRRRHLAGVAATWLK